MNYHSPFRSSFTVNIFMYFIICIVDVYSVIFCMQMHIKMLRGEPPQKIKYIDQKVLSLKAPDVDPKQK